MESTAKKSLIATFRIKTIRFITEQDKEHSPFVRVSFHVKSLLPASSLLDDVTHASQSAVVVPVDVEPLFFTYEILNICAEMFRNFNQTGDLI